ncbi:hypothetical protein Nepgr_008984 [Nepenthes gracilis]|uniref:Uncharacterized protein n=1 Tax=Nepenthes gracilis TaxID=150966 RepID=A0AAD3SA64_NEPGR|nr:hypothetical protein Nepgr_008984 [Nepenthes gracilis]
MFITKPQQPSQLLSRDQCKRFNLSCNGLLVGRVVEWIQIASIRRVSGWVLVCLGLSTSYLPAKDNQARVESSVSCMMEFTVSVSPSEILMEARLDIYSAL